MMRDLQGHQPSMVQARQAELRGLALQIQDRLATANQTIPAVTLVHNQAGHDWALEDLIDSTTISC